MKKILLLVFAAFCAYASMAQNNVYGKKVVALDSVVTNAINARAGSVVEVLKALTVSGGDVNITGTGALQIESVDAIDENRAGNFTAATVDNITINGNDISSSTGDITLTPTGEIYLNGSGVADSIAATRGYVDANDVPAGDNLDFQYNSSGEFAGADALQMVDNTIGVIQVTGTSPVLEIKDNNSNPPSTANFQFQGNDDITDGTIGFESGVESGTFIIESDQANSDILFIAGGVNALRLEGTNQTTDILNGLIVGDTVNFSGYANGANKDNTAPYALGIQADGSIVTIDTAEFTGGGGGSGTPGGVSTNIQYNLSGTFAGSSDMTYDAVDITLNASAVSGQVKLSGTDGVTMESFTVDGQTISNPNQIDIASTGASGTIDLQTGTTPTTGLTVDASQNVSIPNGVLGINEGTSLSNVDSDTYLVAAKGVIRNSTSTEGMQFVGNAYYDGANYQHLTANKAAMMTMRPEGVEMYNSTTSSGTATMGGALRFFNDGGNNWIIENMTSNENNLFQYNTTNTTNSTSTHFIRRTTTGAMADGFGSSIRLQAGDAGQDGRNGAIIGCERDGADDDYAVYINPYRAGNQASGLTMDGTNITMPDAYSATTASAANMHVNSSGVLLRSTSSRKYKENIQNLGFDWSQYNDLRPVTYEPKDTTDNNTYMGFIAEEVDSLGYTELVQYDTAATPDALNYGHFTALNAKAIQELYKMVEAQNDLIADLTARIEELEGQ